MAPSSGSTALAPGCRTISSEPVEPSGKRTSSTSSEMTRPVYARLLDTCPTSLPGSRSRRSPSCGAGAFFARLLRALLRRLPDNLAPRGLGHLLRRFLHRLLRALHRLPRLARLPHVVARQPLPHRRPQVRRHPQDRPAALRRFRIGTRSSARPPARTRPATRTGSRTPAPPRRLIGLIASIQMCSSSITDSQFGSHEWLMYFASLPRRRASITVSSSSTNRNV